MTDVPTISPSQLKTYTECQRKWAFGKFDGLYPPPSAAAAFGSNVHTKLEEWLGNGTPILGKDRVSEVAAAIARHLPPPRTGQVELAYRIERGEGLVYAGRIDFLAVPSDGIPTVFDHKTTAGFQYALDEEDLANDFQGVQYAAAGFLKWPGAKRVRLQWTYAKTKGAVEALPVQALVTREHVEARLGEQDAIGRELVTLYRAKPALSLTAQDVPANPNACTNYGGCPFYGRQCNPHETKEQDTMTKLAEKLAAHRAQKAAAQAPAPPPPEEPKPAAAAETPKVNPPKLSKKAPAAPATPSTAEAIGGGDFRDVVALVALHALQLTFTPSATPNEIAERCYSVADAFLRARA